jgi:hemolysin activation/secretion protein
MLILSMAGFNFAWAQVAPDAGALRQQIERDLKPVLPGRATPLKPAEPAPLKKVEGMSVTVKAFRFAGNTLLGDEQLQPAVKVWLDRSLGFNDLQEAAQAVANTYREAGWIARAYLPAQDVTDGVITIQIVEALFSGARIEGESQGRVAPATILALVAAQQENGQPLNASALDRALLLADDLPGVAVAGTLEPGGRDGETGLLLGLRDEPLVAGEIGLDNGGARTTGAPRAIFGVSLNSPLRVGDQLRGDALSSEGYGYYRLGYSLPLGSDGWRVGVNASQLDYRLVSRDFAALHGSGNSSSFGGDASYPIIRSRLRNLYLTLAYDDKRFHNEANQSVQSDYGVREGSIGLSGNLYDNLAGGGVNNAALSWVSGRVDLGTLNAAENKALAGNFDKFRYSASRLQVLTPTVSLFGAVSGQYAGKDIDSSERFYLGGPAGVRAYPVNEGGGSQGQLANLELRWRLPENITLTGFYDWGHVSNEKQSSGPSYDLKGYGLSVGWVAPGGISLKASWARRDGNNPNPTATGKDQDGSLDKNRVWLSLSIPFEFGLPGISAKASEPAPPSPVVVQPLAVTSSPSP